MIIETKFNVGDTVFVAKKNYSHDPIFTDAVAIYFCSWVMSGPHKVTSIAVDDHNMGKPEISYLLDNDIKLLLPENSLHETSDEADSICFANNGLVRQAKAKYKAEFAGC